MVPPSSSSYISPAADAKEAAVSSTNNQCNKSFTTTISTMTNTIPADLMKYSILPYLNASSLSSLRQVSKQYCTLVSNHCNHVWKEVHDTRWVLSSHQTLTSITQIMKLDEAMKDFRKKHKTPPSTTTVAPSFFDYRMEYARRSTLDQSILVRLTELIQHFQSHNNYVVLDNSNSVPWCDLLTNGLDIVDQLCHLFVLLSTNKNNSMDGIDATKMEAINTIMRSKKISRKKMLIWIQRVIVGIHRCMYFMEWKKLILNDQYYRKETRVNSALFHYLDDESKKNEKEEKQLNISNCKKPRIEDGAIVLSQFYMTCHELVRARQDIQLRRGSPSPLPKSKVTTLTSTLQQDIEDELDSLANILLERLQERRRLFTTTFCCRLSTTESCNGSSSQSNGATATSSGDEYPIKWILEEMKFFFTSAVNEDGEDDNNDREERNVQTNENDPFADIGDIIRGNHGRGTTSTQSASSSTVTRPTLSSSTSFRPFKGNVAEYYEYSNSLLHHILFKSRKGIPISLCIIYASIVRRAVNITLDPVGLPGHFMLSTPICSLSSSAGERIFIDPFRGGNLLTTQDCQRLLHDSGRMIVWSDDFVSPVPYEEVWQRMVRNLLHCHSISSWEGGGTLGVGNSSDDDDDYDVADVNDDGQEKFFRRIALPIRFLLTDVLFRITMSPSSSFSNYDVVDDAIHVVDDDDDECLDVLIRSPPLNPRFC